LPTAERRVETPLPAANRFVLNQDMKITGKTDSLAEPIDFKSFGTGFAGIRQR